MLIAIALAAAVAVAGCGSDDETTTTSASTTPTVDTATLPGLQDCPDITTAVGPVTAVSATIDCSEVAALAEDVLSRDDCVEETESGSNDCTSGEFECVTTIESRPEEFFATICTSGDHTVEFEYELGAPGDSEPAGTPPEPEPQELTTFSTPSGNIGCVMDPEYVRCDIRKRSWEPPPAPSDCELDFGQGIELANETRSHLVCAGDTTLGAQETLEYGETSKVGPYRCISAAAGMTCQAQSGHGFFLSKEAYELY